MAHRGNRLSKALAPILSVLLLAALPASGLAHVVEDWDWHLLKDGKKKRHLHWCVIPELRPGMPDAFPRDKAAEWEKWAKEAFDNWTKDPKGESTGWTFEKVGPFDKNCQIQIRWSTTPRSDFGRAVVPSGEEGDQRADKVQIYIHSVGADKKPRKFGREGEDTLDPVRLLKHEVGHAIRLDDTDNAEDMMSSGVESEDEEKGNHDTSLSEEDYKEARESASGELKVAMREVEKDVIPVATTFPKGPMVRAYLYMAAEAHDRYRDLDGAHDWLDRALELDPYNQTARAMLDKVKAEEQQVGMGRMGVALGTLTIMLERMEEERWHEHEGEEHHEEWEEHHREEGH